MKSIQVHWDAKPKIQTGIVSLVGDSVFDTMRMGLVGNSYSGFPLPSRITEDGRFAAAVSMTANND